MNLYDLLMYPLEKIYLADIRCALLQKASGHILEIGVDTGANFACYDWKSVASLTALDMTIDPDARLRAPATVRFTTGTAQQLPFADNSFDTVVETLVFCSVPDLQKSLAEVKRVLKEDGRLMFIDHVLPENKMLAAIFKGANSFWPRLAHGCNLNRQIEQEILAAGFQFIPAGCRRTAVFRWGTAAPLPSALNSALD